VKLSKKERNLINVLMWLVFLLSLFYIKTFVISVLLLLFIIAYNTYISYIKINEKEDTEY
jgi:hypothetical protein